MDGAKRSLTKQRKSERRNKVTDDGNCSSPDHLYDTIPDDIFLDYTEGASVTSNKENRSLRDIKAYWLEKEKADEDLQASDNESILAAAYDYDLECEQNEMSMYLLHCHRVTLTTGAYNQNHQINADRKRCREFEEMVKVFRPLIVKNVMLHQLLPHLTFVVECYRDDYMNTMGLPKIGIQKNCTPRKYKALPEIKDSPRVDNASSNTEVSYGDEITEDYETFTELNSDEQAPPIPERLPMKPDAKSPLKDTKSLKKRLDDLKLKNEELTKQQKYLNEIALLEQRNYEILRKHAKHERKILNTQKQIEQLYEASLSDDCGDDNDQDYTYIDEDDQILDQILDLK